jgi:hypothetical protein
MPFPKCQARRHGRLPLASCTCRKQIEFGSYVSGIADLDVRNWSGPEHAATVRKGNAGLCGVKGVQMKGYFTIVASCTTSLTSAAVGIHSCEEGESLKITDVSDVQ